MSIEPINPGTKVEDIQADPAARAELSLISPVADAGVYEVQKITFLALASIGAGDFVIIKNKAGQSMAVWLDTTGSVTTPSGTLFTACTVKIKADVHTATTAAQVATLVAAAIAGGSPISTLSFVDNANGSISITSSKLGNVVDPVPHNAAENAAGTVAVSVTTQGVASSLQNKYFKIFDGADDEFDIWFNVGGEGVDPAPGGTSEAVAIAAGASASVVAQAAVAVIDALDDFDANVYDSAQIEVRNAATGNATDVDAGTSGFSVSVLQQGQARGNQGALAADSPGAISNDPAAY